MDSNIPVQPTILATPEIQIPVGQTNQVLIPSYKWKKFLIILGILEIPFPFLGIYMALPLIDIQKQLGTNSITPVLGLIFFILALAIALLQILVGLFSWDLKLGSKKSKLLLGLGLLLAVLTIPAFMLFIIGPIYSTVENIK